MAMAIFDILDQRGSAIGSFSSLPSLILHPLFYFHPASVCGFTHMAIASSTLNWHKALSCLPKVKWPIKRVFPGDILCRGRPSTVTRNLFWVSECFAIEYYIIDWMWKCWAVQWWGYVIHEYSTFFRTFAKTAATCGDWSTTASQRTAISAWRCWLGWAGRDLVALVSSHSQTNHSDSLFVCT